MGDPAILDVFLSKVPIVFLLAIAVIWMVTGLPRHLSRMGASMEAIPPALRASSDELKAHVTTEVRGAETRILLRMPEPAPKFSPRAARVVEDGTDEVLTWGVPVRKNSRGGNGPNGASA